MHAAGMNNRRLLEELTGRTLTQKMRHAPYALRRSLLAELEERSPRSSRPRPAPVPGLHRHLGGLLARAPLLAYLTGRAVPGTIEYTYVDLALHRQPGASCANMLALRQHDTFCLNDTAPTTPEQDALLHSFLEAYFPTRAPWER